MKPKALFQSGILLLFASCTLHPKYHRPNTNPPIAWRIPIEAETATNDNSMWWKQLNDPVLDNFIVEALEYNQDIKVAIETVNGYLARLGISRSKLYPQIQAIGGALREKVSATDPPLPSGIPSIQNEFGLLFNASYLIDFWGEVKSSNEAAYHELLESIESRKNIVLTIVSTVATTYLRLRDYDNQLIIALATLETRKESLKLASIRFELGLTSELQVDQALAEVESAKIVVEETQISIAESENLLCVLLGKPSTTVERGLSIDQLKMPSKLLAYIPSEILNQRPDVLAAEQKLIAANALIGVAKAKFFPQFSITGALGTATAQMSTFLESASNIWSYGFNLIQEVFTGGKLTSNLRLSEAQMRQALHEYQSTILNAFKEVNNALVNHKINLQIVETQSIHLASLKRYYYLSLLRYNEGQVDYLTVLDSERQLFRAELELAQSQANSYISLVDIYKTLGGNWVTSADSFSIDNQK
jgi:multidrug efflux system outer membrane protein